MKTGMRKFLLAIIVPSMLVGAVEGAQKEPVLIPPPMAKPVTVSVTVGQPKEIVLTIGGRIEEPMTVLIRKPPRFGRLGDLQRTGRTTATVVYTPEPGAAAGEDSFLYAAKSMDSPVSASAAVRIHLVEDPPRLEFPEELEFGSVFLGDSAEKTITLRNAGGGIASGQLRPNTPWRISGSGTYKLSAGAESVLRVVFAPTEERDFRDKVQMTPDPRSVMSVSGAGVSPVSWNKEGIVFTPKQHETGKADLELSNHTPEERKLNVEWPVILKAEKEIVIPPNATVSLPVELLRNPSLNFEGAAAVRSGNFQAQIPIRIFPAAAKLEVIPERRLKLVATPPDAAPKGKFVVKNTGGSDAPLEILAPLGVIVTPDSRNLVLSPAQEQAFEVRLENSEPETPTLRIQSPTCEPVEISLEAPASKPDRAALPVEAFLTIPKKPMESPGIIPRALHGTSPLAKVDIVSSEPHEIVLSWKLPSPQAGDFRIERRIISPGSDAGVSVTWVPWQGARLAVDNGIVTARLERLPENTVWTIHVVPLDEMGHPGEPSPAFRIATKAGNPLRIPWWVWLPVMMLAAAGGLRLWQDRKMSAQTKDNDRISRLENTSER